MPSWKQQSREKFSDVLFNFMIKYITTDLQDIEPINILDLNLNRNFTTKTLLKHPELVFYSDRDTIIVVWQFVINLSLKNLQKLLNNPKYVFSDVGINCNRHVTPEFVSKNINRKWNYTLASNPNFDYSTIKELLPDANDVDIISNLHTITPEILESSMFKKVSYNGKIDINYIIQHPELDWKIISLLHTKLNFQHLVDYPFLKDLAFVGASVPWNEIVQHPEINWCPFELTCNNTVPCEDFLKICDKYRLIINEFSGHPNITFKFILEHIDEFPCDEELESNSFRLEKNISRRNFYREVKLRQLLNLTF